MYSCPPMSEHPPPPACLPREPTTDEPSKYYREIGASMIDNQLIIRMEREKNKSKKSRGQWDPPCDCDIVEIQRPTKKEGPKIINGGDNNRILFRIHSRPHFLTKDDPSYRPQAISYEVGACKGGRDTNDQCRTITIHPQLGGPGAQEIHTDRISDGDKNVFLLKVKKKTDSPEQKKRNIEVELRTSKPRETPAVQSVMTPQLAGESWMQGKEMCQFDETSKKDSRKKRK